MPLPSKPFSDWTGDDLQELVTDPPAVETARVDFKAECNLLSADKGEREKARRDILVDICAMANGTGGALLIGVRQSSDPTHPPLATKTDPVADPERLKKAIDGLANTHLDVRPGPLRYHSVPREKPVILIVEVPPNSYSLTMVTCDSLNQFWIRRGTDNRLMTTDEIEYRIGQFTKVRGAAEAELSQIRGKMRRADHAGMAWFAGVPLARARDHIPVDVTMIKNLLCQSSYFKEYGDRDRTKASAPALFFQWLVPSVSGIWIPGYHRKRAILEIRRDGSLIYALGLLSNANPEMQNLVSLREIYEVILSGLHAFADLQNHFGISKAAIVQAGLSDVDGKMPVAEGLYPSPRAFRDVDVTLDPILLDDHSQPKEIFMEWATQLANALEQEEPLSCPPWVP